MKMVLVVALLCATLLLLFSLIFLLLSRFSWQAPAPFPTPMPPPTVTAVPVTPQPLTRLLGPRTKASNCAPRRGLPDPECTPGAIFTAATRAMVCQSGYAASIRAVSSSLREQAFLSYDVLVRPAGAYEIDHLVPLELGGSNDLANLWPEDAVPPGYHEKDKVENKLHAQVCKGEVELGHAQRAIATNWEILP